MVVVWTFPFVLLAVLVSHRYLDADLARNILKILNSFSLLRNGTSNIPDALFLLVCSVSTLLWMRYFVLRRQEVTPAAVRFYQVAGTAVPLAFLLKWVLKFVFGRINTRVWLTNQTSVLNFHWFQGGGNYGGFPSGHMMVFAAFFTAVWLFNRRYRPHSAAFIMILSIALIATNYHFLSDVIAGGYAGFAIAILTNVALKKNG